MESIPEPLLPFRCASGARSNESCIQREFVWLSDSLCFWTGSSLLWERVHADRRGFLYRRHKWLLLTALVRCTGDACVEDDGMVVNIILVGSKQSGYRLLLDIIPLPLR